MPGGDRTGPMGAGPRTGRAAGYCGGANVPGFMNAAVRGFFGGGGFGGGRCGGRCGGRGRRNRYYATGLTAWQQAAATAAEAAATAATAPRQGASQQPQQAQQPTMPEQELEQLKQQAAEAAAVLDRIQQRISELEESAPR